MVVHTEVIVKNIATPPRDEDTEADTTAGGITRAELDKALQKAGHINARHSVATERELRKTVVGNE